MGSGGGGRGGARLCPDSHSAEEPWRLITQDASPAPHTSPRRLLEMTLHRDASLSADGTRRDSNGTLRQTFEEKKKFLENNSRFITCSSRNRFQSIRGMFEV